jgi:hypothetical protein
MKVWCAGEFHGDGEDEHSDIAALRPALGEAAFTVAWAEGLAMTREQAIGYALAQKRLDLCSCLNATEGGRQNSGRRS